jgi:transposase
LNQIGLQLISDHQAGIPILMKPLSGNDSDKDSFRETINTHINQLKQNVGLEYIIADSALYTAKTLQDLENCLWISRVPETLEVARELIAAIIPDLMENPESLNCRSLGCIYGDVKQRWLVVYSPEARKRATKTVDKQLLTQTMANFKAFQKLMKQDFACEADGKKALIAFKKKLMLTEIVEAHIKKIPHYQKAGRPKPHQKPEHFTYLLYGVLAHRTQQRLLKIQQKSCFILATNQLDIQELSNEELLKKYKNQQKVERGFRFLKDPMFMAESKYLKSPKRVMALTMIMTICLLVYAALEYRIRQSLQTAQESFPNQKGQEVDNPTARWVFQFFSGIHVLVIQKIQQIVLNLNCYHIRLLELLGEEYQKLYSESG